MVDYAKVRNAGSPARVLSRAMKGPTMTDYDSSAWTATHEDGTTCSAWLDCNLSHGWVDAHHEDHEGDCLAWAEYPNGLVMPLDAYADAVTLAIRLNADEFRYWNGGDTVSVLVRYDGAESGYVTTHHEGI